MDQATRLWSHALQEDVMMLERLTAMTFPDVGSPYPGMDRTRRGAAMMPRNPQARGH